MAQTGKSSTNRAATGGLAWLRALLTGDSGRMARRLALVLALILVLIAGWLFDRAPDWRSAMQQAAAPAPPPSAPAAGTPHHPAARMPRFADAAPPPFAPVSVRTDYAAPGALHAHVIIPDGQRRRAIFATPAPDDERPFAGPAPDEALFALRGPAGRFSGVLDAGALYRLNAARPLFARETFVALSDRFPVIWVRVAAVPEPASWISLTLGFAMLGIALRRLRRRAHRAPLAYGDNP